MKMKKILEENTTGQRIKAARARKGFTQEELAELLYLPKSNISAYENDRVKLREEVIVDLANVLDVSADYLLGRKKTEENPYIPDGYYWMVVLFWNCLMTIINLINCQMVHIHCR